MARGRARRAILARGRRLLAALATANPAAPARHRSVRRAVWALLDRGDPLGAHALAATHGPGVLDGATRRHLWYDLERRGYLVKALQVARACPRLGVWSRARRRRLEGQLAVLSGGFVPAVPPPPAGYVARAGRVLHVVTNALPHAQTGYTLRTHYTARAQADAGLDPHVVTQMGFGAGRGVASHQDVDGIRYHMISGPDRTRTPLDVWLADHVTRVAALVGEIRPAVLHAASDFLNALTAEAVGRAYGLPVVYESRGFWEETWLSRQERQFGWDRDRLAEEYGLPDLYVLRRNLEDRCRRSADRVVTLSDPMLDRIHAGGVDRSRITVIPNAVDPDAFAVRSRDRSLATRLGISDDTTVVGYISSLSEYEGIDVLISAYGLVRSAAEHRVRLVIVGKGQHRRELESHAAALGLTDVVFVGRVPHADVLDYYSLIDIFVVPRRPVEVCHLVTPLKPYEAFATGRTVVLSNVRALAAIADQSGAAELFEAGDEQALARILLALLADPDRRHRLAVAGAEWVRSHASWAANASAYRRLYADLGAVAADVGSTPESRTG